ncbi:hypothetical protein MMPV_005214 [Pyropia vietnamensis]
MRSLRAPRGRETRRSGGRRPPSAADANAATTAAVSAASPGVSVVAAGAPVWGVPPPRGGAQDGSLDGESDACRERLGNSHGNRGTGGAAVEAAPQLPPILWLPSAVEPACVSSTLSSWPLHPPAADAPPADGSGGGRRQYNGKRVGAEYRTSSAVPATVATAPISFTDTDDTLAASSPITPAPVVGSTGSGNGGGGGTEKAAAVAATAATVATGIREGLSPAGRRALRGWLRRVKAAARKGAGTGRGDSPGGTPSGGIRRPVWTVPSGGANGGGTAPPALRLSSPPPPPVAPALWAASLPPPAGGGPWPTASPLVSTGAPMTAAFPPSLPPLLRASTFASTVVAPPPPPAAESAAAKQARRVLRNREVALAARVAAKARMATLEATNVALVAENGRLRAEVDAVMDRLAALEGGQGQGGVTPAACATDDAANAGER